MKKVMFVISSLGGGGAERVLVHVANEMAQRGVEVKILKTGTRRAGSYELDPRIAVIQVPRMEGAAPLRACRMIRYMRGVFRSHSDYTVISFLSDNNMLSIAASTGLQNRVVVCERNDPSRNCGNEPLRRVRNFLYCFADGSVFQTQDMKEYFSPTIQRKGVIIPNPVLIDDDVPGCEEIRKEDNGEERPAGHSGRKKRILAAGRLTAQKNYPMLLRAFALLHADFPDYTLEIYGDGELREELSRQIAELGLEKAAFLFPFSDDIYRLMRESTVYVSSSDYEGISNTMLEAMALGVPSVVTDCPIGGARLVIRDGENGLLVPVGDHAALAAALARIFTDETLRRKLAGNSVHVLEDYSIGRITDLWEQVL